MVCRGTWIGLVSISGEHLSISCTIVKTFGVKSSVTLTLSMEFPGSRNRW